jgi:DNA integrity scanning protein DisA with diadenylate cyclase activity
VSEDDRKKQTVEVDGEQYLGPERGEVFVRILETNGDRIAAAFLNGPDAGYREFMAVLDEVVQVGLAGDAHDISGALFVILFEAASMVEYLRRNGFSAEYVPGSPEWRKVNVW